MTIVKKPVPAYYIINMAVDVFIVVVWSFGKHSGWQTFWIIFGSAMFVYWAYSWYHAHAMWTIQKEINKLRAGIHSLWGNGTGR
jgi:hypothetical protein